MTPEERARHYFGDADNIAWCAAAIRAAVDAETEACAKIVDANPASGTRETRFLRDVLAARIRERRKGDV